MFKTNTKLLEDMLEALERMLIDTNRDNTRFFMCHIFDSISEELKTSRTNKEIKNLRYKLFKRLYKIAKKKYRSNLLNSTLTNTFRHIYFCGYPWLYGFEKVIRLNILRTLRYDILKKLEKA